MGGWGRRSGRRRPLSVPRMRPDFTYRMFSTKLRVIGGFIPSNRPRTPQGPACPAWGVGSTVRTSRLLSVPRMRPDFTYRIFSTKLRVIVHNFTHQLFDQLLADHAVLAAGFQVAGYDAGEFAPRKSSPAHPGGFTPSNRPHRLSWLRVFRLAPDDPPPRTPPCHHLPRINAFRSNK